MDLPGYFAWLGEPFRQAAHSMEAVSRSQALPTDQVISYVYRQPESFIKLFC